MLAHVARLSRELFKASQGANVTARGPQYHIVSKKPGDLLIAVFRSSITMLKRRQLRTAPDLTHVFQGEVAFETCIGYCTVRGRSVPSALTFRILLVSSASVVSCDATPCQQL
ncbi:hypothetical protein TNCV_775171 [Trichonephila clavipes]|nr:hypothetical protein TNCV_775171 [Trichonephila clavipes]